MTTTHRALIEQMLEALESGETNLIRECAITAANKYLKAPEQSEPAIWYDGFPPFPQDQEWFIAETTYGDRVVLTSMDKGREHKGNYAFKTADQTYMKATSVKRWMQFPDCEYISPAQQPTNRVHETDIYEFAGWLTTRKGVMEVGSSKEAGPMAEAVGEYLKKFPEKFAPQPTTPEPVNQMLLAACKAFDEAMTLCSNHPDMSHERDALVVAVLKARSAITAAEQAPQPELTDDEIDAVLDSQANIVYTLSNKRQQLRLFARAVLAAQKGTK